MCKCRSVSLHWDSHLDSFDYFAMVAFFFSFLFPEYTVSWSVCLPGALRRTQAPGNTVRETGTAKGDVFYTTNINHKNAINKNE